MGTEHTVFVLEIGGFIGNLWNNSFNHVGEVEFKLQGEWGVSGWEEVVGVHIDDSTERFGCEGKVKNSEVVGDG